MFDKIHIYTGVLLVLIYMGAWILNGVGNYHFSLDALIILYVARIYENKMRKYQNK